MQRIKNRIIFLMSLFLITSTISLAQSWIELGNRSDLEYYESAAIATDASGNVYTTIMNESGRYDIIKWNGTSWTGVGSLNANSNVGVIAIDNASGNIYASGNFKNANDEYYVAKWDGISWSELGAGTNALHANHFMSAIAVDETNGNVYTAGHFSDASGGLYVAKWNGTTWSQLGIENELNVTYLIPALAVDASGNVYAAANDGSGKSYIAKWNGTSWSELGGSNSLEGNGMLFVLLIDKFGYIYTAGQRSNSNSYRYIAKWDGTSWSELGELPQRMNSIYSLASDNLGNIYVDASSFADDNGNYMPKWDGSQWTKVRTNGVPSHIAIDPSGNIYATGTFTKSNHTYYIAKYDPTETPTITGVNHSQQHKKLLFYPNPATNMVSCDMPEAGVMEVHSMQGGVLYTQQVSSGVSSIDLSTLATGMYCVVFKGQNNSYAPIKIVKQ